MARGGKRNGAGRKPTESAVRSRAIADKMATDGIMPLEIMVKSMRADWAAYESAIIAGDEEAGAFRRSALSIANDCAPFLHPKLAPVDAKTGETARFVIIDPTHGL